jgi:hypothetical protein
LMPPAVIMVRVICNWNELSQRRQVCAESSNCGLCSSRFVWTMKKFMSLPDKFVFGQSEAGNNWAKGHYTKLLNWSIRCWMLCARKRKDVIVYKVSTKTISQLQELPTKVWIFDYFFAELKHK